MLPEGISLKTEIETGSAPASGAVFRALAENIECNDRFPRARENSCAK
jgi:hypothetical protein